MTEQQSLLTELEFNPVLAGTGKRFLNYLVDVIIFYILFVLLFAGMILSGDRMNLSGGSYESAQVLLQVFIFTFFAIYYFLSELLFKGRTIGKFITGTKAVNEDGTEISAKTALLRSLSRIVPFEPFSAFGGRPWHDKWTKTYVIDIKKTAFNDLMAQA